MKAAHTASTFSFKAMSTPRASLIVDVEAMLAEIAGDPKDEMCCTAAEGRRVVGAFLTRR